MKRDRHEVAIVLQQQSDWMASGNNTATIAHISHQRVPVREKLLHSVWNPLRPSGRRAHQNMGDTLTTRTRLTAAVAVVGAASLALSATTSSAATRPSSAPRATSKALIIGTLLPQTGSLAFLGPPEIAGVELAIKQINAAGGVLGKKVVLDQADSGDTSTNIASQSTNSLLGKGVSAIIGAASSSVTLSVIDKITSARSVLPRRAAGHVPGRRAGPEDFQ
jgi:hypothetical protein